MPKRAMPEAFSWTDEREAELRRLVGEHKNSAEVAKALGCTRNAICGKASKLGLKFTSHFWREQNVETLRNMAAEGKTAAMIAEALGIEPGPIYDKASRLKIKLVSSRPGPAPATPRPKRAWEATEPGVVSIKTTGPTPASLNLRMWDPQFTSTCCKWATNGEGDDLGFLFCAAPRLKGLPYCRAHAAAAYRPAPPRPPSAVKDSGRTGAPREDAEPKPLDFEKAA